MNSTKSLDLLDPCESNYWLLNRLIWIFLAIWCGVIIGNLSNIKRLLCSSNKRNNLQVNKNTQYDINDFIRTFR